MKIAARLLPLLIGVLFLLNLISLPAHAQVKQPTATTDCGGFCFSWYAWNGTTRGAFGSLETTGASMTFHNAGTLQRFLAVWGGTNGLDVNSRIHVGEEVDTPGNGLCGSFHNYQAAYFFMQSFDTSGAQNDWVCWDMPSGDANHPINVQIGQYVSSGGGMQIQIWGWTSDHYTRNIPWTKGNSRTYASMGLQEQIEDPAVTGHEVWGVYESNMQYLDSGLTFHQQIRNVDYISVDHAGYGPPQLFFVHAASPTYPGGQSLSCDYETDNGPGCTHSG